MSERFDPATDVTATPAYLDVVDIDIARFRSPIERPMEEDEQPPEHQVDGQAVWESRRSRSRGQINFGRQRVFPCVELDAENTLS